MTARDALADILSREFGPHADRTAIKMVLHDIQAAGYSIIHDSENHGPTRDRAAVVALSQISEPGLSDNPAYVRFDPVSLMAKKIAAIIRAMTTGGRDAE